MARVSTILTNFRAGELSPKLFGRIDLQKYSEGCETLENMLVFPQEVSHADLELPLQVEQKMMAR